MMMRAIKLIGNVCLWAVIIAGSAIAASLIGTLVWLIFDAPLVAWAVAFILFMANIALYLRAWNFTGIPVHRRR